MNIGAKIPFSAHRLFYHQAFTEAVTTLFIIISALNAKRTNIANITDTRYLNELKHAYSLHINSCLYIAISACRSTKNQPCWCEIFKSMQAFKPAMIQPLFYDNFFNTNSIHPSQAFHKVSMKYVHKIFQQNKKPSYEFITRL